MTTVTTLLLLLVAATTTVANAFTVVARPAFRPGTTTLAATSTAPPSTKKSGTYEPKWKKKATLADQLGSKAPSDVGLKGSIAVMFRQGNSTISTVAMPGQPLRDVASQAGQFIKYGCGKGECGTCECLVNGAWIRPCTAVVPAFVEQGGPYIVNVKEIKAKDQGSGKFYSIKSFIKGFYNNFIGMVGFVKYRKHARSNWAERQEYEALVRQKTLERKRARELQGSNKLQP